MEEDKKQKIGIFRYGVIGPLVGLKETDERQREKLIGEIVARPWEIPYSGRSYIGRTTVRDWLRRYEESGRRLDSLYPQMRSDRGKRRSMGEEEERALVELKRQQPAATLPVLLKIAKRDNLLPPDFRASVQSIYRVFKAHGLDGQETPKQDMRRYEAELSNDLWQSDCMHGIPVTVQGKQRKTFLFAFLDDHSRLILHAEFYLRENLECFSDAFQKALQKRGLPRKLYVDNGPYFRAHQLQFVTASLGIALIHSTAYRPEGKGKIERFHRTLRMQFFPLMKDNLTLEELNDKLQQWLDRQYHITENSITKEKPLERYVRHRHLIRSAPKNLTDFFRVRAQRKVDKDRTVSLHGRVFEAPVDLIQRKVTLLYHESDPLRVEVLFQETSYGFLTPQNSHINARIKRQNNITTLIPSPVPPPQQLSEGQDTVYQGGKLFERRRAQA